MRFFNTLFNGKTSCTLPLECQEEIRFGCSEIYLLARQLMKNAHITDSDFRNIRFQLGRIEANIHPNCVRKLSIEEQSGRT